MAENIAKPDWISVDNELPDNARPVLTVYIWDEYGEPDIDIGRYYAEYKKWDFLDAVTVTHWMELPDLPEWKEG